MPGPLPAAVWAVLWGTGFGLLLWLGISVALVPPGASMAALRAPQMWSLILALALLGAATVIAVAASEAPRSGRGLLHAATRWHARRNALGLSAVVLALAAGGVLSWGSPGASRALALGLLGMLLSLTSLGAVVANAMAQPVSPSPTTPSHPLIVPVQVLTAMLTGLALMFALLSGLLTVGPGGGRMLMILLLLGMLAAATSALYWRDARRARANRQADAGGFRRSGLAVPLLVVAVPGLAWALAAADVGGPTLWLGIVALASFAGALLDRHAFLRHATGQAPAT